MIDIVGVRFKNMGKIYYFDPGDLQVQRGMGVIVETARGMEFGTVVMEITPVKEEDITKPLKKIVRLADERDIKRHEENESKKSKAMSICQEKIQLHKLEMKLIDVEYTFDNNKIIFYFTADGRIDFRELVKDLAAVFKMRIELRQIGVRDEAKMLGGVGSCGRGLCCATWLSDFQPVSIKMAKVQNLSLNPAKISGVCGRLMCCLKYENDVYLNLRKDVPEVNEKVETDQGVGKVIESDILQGKIKVRLYTGEFDESGIEKLGSDILEFTKDDVKRLDKKDKAKRVKPSPAQLPESETEQEEKEKSARKFRPKNHNRKKKRKEEIHDQED
ncbi:MAG: stage 0 sporulation family protein [Hornefia sp.]|nr:stage 0 sporulation family protein [Hornefia sp.]